jgi:cytosine/adenosine deaminase-related metal-dependent hydrolase
MDRPLSPSELMTSCAIDGAQVLFENGFAAGTVLVEGRQIAAVAWSATEREALRTRAATVVTAEGHWLIPGLVDGHAHGYAALLRGTENSLPLELWAFHTVLYGRAFDEATLRAAILLGAAERIHAGITGWIDHSPMMHLGEAALAAHEASGLRVGYAPFLHDVADDVLLELALPAPVAGLAGGAPPLDPPAYAAEFAALVETARARSGRVSMLLGPNAPQRCSPAAWELWRLLRERHAVPVHTHLMETRAQAAIGSRGWPGGLVAEMERQGLLGEWLSVAHGVWLTPAERELLAAHRVVVVHNPASNLMLGSGIMPLLEARRAGLRVALGTDSANTGGRHDLFQAMRLALMLPRAGELDHTHWPHGRDVLDMATRNGAAALGLEGRAGRIGAGQLADLVLVRCRTAGTLALAPGEDALVQHGGPEAVDSVMVDGRWVMRGQVLLAFDEAATLADAEAAIIALHERTVAKLAMLEGALPALTQALPSTSRAAQPSATAEAPISPWPGASTSS